MIVDPMAVLANAPVAPQVVVISRYDDGKICVGSSHPADEACALMREARDWIQAGCPEQ